MPRVIVDTNIFISALLGGTVAQKLVEALTSSKFQLITSQTFLAELIETARDKELSALISEEDLTELIHLIVERGLFVKPTHPINSCRDPKDNFILEVAVTGRAHVILTHDKDLRVLDPFQNITITRPKEFLDSLT